MGAVYSNYTHDHKQAPKSGFGFLEVVIGGVLSRAVNLVEILDAPHQHGGNPGYPAVAMLAAYVMQFVLNERYANGFLNRLGSDDQLLSICSLERAPSEGAYSLGDKGYDSLKNIQHVVSLGMIPVIAVRLPEKDKATGERLYDGIYDKDGRPTCIGGKSMEYALTDPEEGHLFRCPAEGCSLKETVQFTRHCDYWHYEKPEGRLLRIVGLLPRCSDEWKAEYKKRPIIERHFSSVKQSRLLDTHRYLNIGKMSLHAAMSMLAYLATALAHLKADDYAHMRHMRIKLPKARGERRRRRLPSPACRDPDCACCDRWLETA